MSMISRITDIFQSNINAMLDKAEDPKKVIGLMIEEMEQTLAEVRAVAASHIATRKTLNRNITRCQQQSQDWYQKAELAMQKGKEDLAKAALKQKQTVDSEIQQLESQQQQAQALLDKLGEDATRLQSKLSEARAKQRTLWQREQVAQTRKVTQAQQQVDTDAVLQRFEHYESRIDRIEAEIEAFDLGSESLQSQFAELEKQDELDKQLAELKQKVA